MCFRAWGDSRLSKSAGLVLGMSLCCVTYIHVMLCVTLSLCHFMSLCACVRACVVFP